MPKATPIQPSFAGGEFSPRVHGRVDNERYKTGADTILNYLPMTQGPMSRRPGTKYAANAKDASKPPALLEFKFSQTQNYVLEFGDKYIRFFTNGGQITTTSTHFLVFGNTGQFAGSASSNNGATFGSSHFHAMRQTPLQQPYEVLLTSSVVTSGTILEIGSPYAWPDVFGLKISQKADTLFIVNSGYPEYRLQRIGNTQWDLRAVLSEDGPYLPYNSYKAVGDQPRTKIVAGAPAIINSVDGSMEHWATTGPVLTCSSIVDNGAGVIRIHVAETDSGLVTGQKVVVLGVAGTTEANNGTSTVSAMTWPIKRISGTSFDLIGSQFTNAYVGSGKVYPALFETFNNLPNDFADVGRPIGLIRSDGGRAWGRISRVRDAARFDFYVDSALSPVVTGSSLTLIVDYWQMGVYSKINGYPDAIAFHQDRKWLAGCPGFPQQVDASMSGKYTNFKASGSSLIVADNNALQFTLASEQLNPIRWLKSDSNGLLAGGMASEWKMAPSNQAAALTPTNFNASETSSFGSHTSDALKTGNAMLYIQSGQRRVREMNYFFQVDNYRSTDMSELADHMTVPGLTRLSVQKEPIPVIWSHRADDTLLSMSYSRDDVTLKVGWAKHQLGGNSDSAGTAPLVKAIATVAASSGIYDQLWIAARRFINGTSVVTIEYTAKMFEQGDKIEDSYHFDCGATYDSPLFITNITQAGSAIVTSAAHGLADGDQIRIDGVVGLNSSITDVDGIIHNSNLVNAHVFLAGSVSANAFFLQTLNSSFIDSRTYTPYVSGGLIRKMITSISGLTWLKNETVSILADGKVHPNVVVNSAGVIALQYKSAKVQIGYAYNSDGKTLRPDAGAADGTSIGKLRRAYKVAFMLNHTGGVYFGTSYNRLTPLKLGEEALADIASPLFTGIVRDMLQSESDFDGQVCWRQNTGLPGMIQTVTTFMEGQDV